MKKIEPVAWRQSDGVITEDKNRADSWLRFGWTCQSLWTDDAMQAVAEAVLIKLQEEIGKRQILNDETPIDRAFNRGLDAADAIVGDFDIAAIINQLKGE